MVKAKPKTKPTWTSVKAQLAHFDRAGLLGLIQDLYTSNHDNRIFLHARFDLGEDALMPYKETLDRWLWPDVMRNQNTSVVNAKQAISSYKKAVGDPAGLAELMVFYCEQAAGFLLSINCPAVSVAPSSPALTIPAPSPTISATASATTWTLCSPNTSRHDRRLPPILRGASKPGQGIW